MQPTEYIWLNGATIEWDDAKVHALTHALHYGSSVFEGIRCYETPTGPAIFRLQDHIRRLFYSAGTLKMEVPYTENALNEAAVELIKKNNLKECYIRPLVFYGYGVMGLNPRDAKVDTMIAVWPWGRYLPHDMVDVKTSSFIRIHPKSLVPDAKVSGHYINSINAVLEVRGTKYHEVLLLDYEGNVAEGPGENIFIVKNKVLKTPKLGTILAGITRATVMDMAARFSLKVEETTLKVEDIYSADEAFYTGTAAEITPIRSLDDKNIGSGEEGPITKQIRTTYASLVRGKETWGEDYLTRV